VFAHLGAGGVAGSTADLTIGYRVPEPILAVANRLLPHTGVDAAASRSVRFEGAPPAWHRATTGELMVRVSSVVQQVKHRHRLTGVVAPVGLHAELAQAIGAAGLRTVDHVHELAPHDVPLFGPEQVKGLEFDGVVVVNPHDILAAGGNLPLGARLLYVAMTRAVQELAFVTDAEPPPLIA